MPRASSKRRQQLATAGHNQHYPCPVVGCVTASRTPTGLSLHIKKKHPDFIRSPTSLPSQLPFVENNDASTSIQADQDYQAAVPPSSPTCHMLHTDIEDNAGNTEITVSRHIAFKECLLSNTTLE